MKCASTYEDTAISFITTPICPCAHPRRGLMRVQKHFVCACVCMCMLCFYDDNFL